MKNVEVQGTTLKALKDQGVRAFVLAMGPASLREGTDRRAELEENFPAHLVILEDRIRQKPVEPGEVIIIEVDGTTVYFCFDNSEFPNSTADYSIVEYLQTVFDQVDLLHDKVIAVSMFRTSGIAKLRNPDLVTTANGIVFLMGDIASQLGNEILIFDTNADVLNALQMALRE